MKEKKELAKENEDALYEKALEILNRIDYGGLSLQSKLDLLKECLLTRKPQKQFVSQDDALILFNTAFRVSFDEFVEQLKELDINVANK